MEVNTIEKAREIVYRWGKKPENIIEMMHDIQNEFNYLPHDVILEVSKEANVSLSSVYHLATFFNAFSLKPKGKHQVCVCMGTACHAYGAPKIVTVLEKELGIKIGEMTPDMNYGLEIVRCVGACGIAPVVSVGKDLYGKVTSSGVAKIIKKYGSK
jgi:NADH:ubiquinone oxidoreductase subunit E